MRRLPIVLFALVLALSCTRKEHTFVIGVSQCSEDIWRTKLNDEIQTASYLWNNVEVRFASSEDDNRRQISQIRTFIRQGVDLLVVSPNQLNSITEAIDEAYGDGIPVILFDRKTGSDNYTAFIGADNREIGRQMGKYIATCLGGKGNVLEIQGLEGSSPAIERHLGFMEALRAFPEIVVIASLYGEWLEADARSVTDSILNITDDIDAVFAQNDRMAKGARESFESHGLSGNVLFFGIDALPGKDGGLEAVSEGLQKATYTYPTRGDIVMDVAMSILGGKPFKRETVLQSTLVDADLARTLLIQEEELSRRRKELDTIHSRADAYLHQVGEQRVILFLLLSLVTLLIIVAAIILRNAIVRSRLASELKRSNDDLKRLHEELRQNTEAKLDFFTNISHEIRTPLTMITGNVDALLEDDSIRGNKRESLLSARRSAGTLLRLTEEILDFRKVENGDMHLVLTEFDLPGALRLWLDGFSDAASIQGKKLDFIATPEHFTVCADMRKIERVFYNLISNSFKYTEKGASISVEASLDGEEAVFKVADTGIGIPESELDSVFDRFFRAGNAGSGGGTGIGLALVRSFISLHGGRISAESKEGEGTVMTVHIPVHQKNEPSISGTDVRPEDLTEYFDAGLGPSSDNETMEYLAEDGTGSDKDVVLVVEDHDDIRKFIKDTLGDSYHVITSPNGKDGLDKALQFCPDIVVSDIMMPVMDGIEMCRSLKSNIRTSHIPVILLTARSREENVVEGMEEGADYYLTKPFSARILKATISSLLKNRRRLKDYYSDAPEPIPSTATDPERNFLDRFREIVRARLTDPELSIDDISREMGLSRIQLYRKIKALTGDAPVEVIRIIRLKTADRLLRTTAMTVSEVADATGFSSPSYFSRCFKAHFGRNPSDKG